VAGQTVTFTQADPTQRPPGAPTNLRIIR
jgi:hypothetical protein